MTHGLVLNLIPVEALDPARETTGCSPVPAPSPALLPNGQSWVALVERGGDCSFVDKVRHMQASGAKAVVVGDNQHSGLITMQARESTWDVHIPSVFIAQNHYRELQYLGLEFEKAYLIKMSPEDMNWPLLDVIILIVLSPALVVVFLYFLWKIRVRQQHVVDKAPTDVVTNLPIKVFYGAKLKENDPVECAICLDEFEDEVELRVLPCRHEYHVACIDNWLTTRKKFCPICKRDVNFATEATPLLRPSARGSSSRRVDPYGSSSRSNMPSGYTAYTSPSSSSSAAVAAAPSLASASDGQGQGSGPRFASSWPQPQHYQNLRPISSVVAINEPPREHREVPSEVTASSRGPVGPYAEDEEEVIRRV
ncbi:hypothetical protein BGZ98_004761 [Dissophora globulifera]|nr:hypothetical protein BGZ98_004761 [Dissophora globulifera]